MLAVRRWLEASDVRAAAGGTEKEPALRSAIDLALARLAAHPPDIARTMNATFVLNDGTGTPWTIRVSRGTFAVARGAARKADAVVEGDPLTLAAVVRGTQSALELFLAGRLSVRGHLALGLMLDGLFERRLRPSRRPRPRRITADGIDTFYLDAGSGPPVILLHGLGASNASMLPTLIGLSRTYRVLAPDLPGFGDTDKPRASYDPGFFSRWLVAFMDRLGIARAHLVGNSMGGRVALELGLSHSSRVGRLVLFAPSLAFRKYRQAAPLVRLLSPEMGVLPLPLLRAYVRRSVHSLFVRPERLLPSFYDSATDEFVRVFASPRGRVALFAAARQIYLETPFGPGGFWTRLPELRVPSLFVWGDGDRLVPAAFARHVRAALPLAHSVVLQESGHIPQFEHPEETNRLARDFLDADRVTAEDARPFSDLAASTSALAT
jgi:pimeloyl-ACP methyl ester carboxylesterase